MDSFGYDAELRKIGYVGSGLSSSRGDYFIDSYLPGSKKKHKLPPGLVEVHMWRDYFEIKTPRGDFKDVKSTIDALTSCVK